jgi:hypothetical protein
MRGKKERARNCGKYVRFGILKKLHVKCYYVQSFPYKLAAVCLMNFISIQNKLS